MKTWRRSTAVKILDRDLQQLTMDRGEHHRLSMVVAAKAVFI